MLKKTKTLPENTDQSIVKLNDRVTKLCFVKFVAKMIVDYPRIYQELEMPLKGA